MRLCAGLCNSEEKAHADNCGLNGLQRVVLTFPDIVAIPRYGARKEGQGSGA